VGTMPPSPQITVARRSGLRIAAKGFAEYGTRLYNPDFVKMAEAFGVKATLVESLDDLEPALKAASEGGGVRVVLAQ
ncbi:thiamine pyrophosphate-dependent enzyme, partial [Rhizobium ruizarguesonis]